MKERLLVNLTIIFLIFLLVIVSAQNETNQTIKCYSDKDCHTLDESWCQDSQKLCEKIFKCLNPETVNSECSPTERCIDCKDGCKNGACQTIRCYQDSECGESFTKKYCKDSSVCTYETTYFCQNPGTVDSFCNVKKGAESCTPCSYGCQNSACISGTTTTTCKDSDNGIDYYQQGTACVDSNCKTDSCTDTNLLEFFCEGNNLASGTYGCERGCENGACISGTTTPTTPSCSDTDGGLNYYEKGSLMWGSDTVSTDSCEDEITLREESCVPNPGPNEGTMSTNIYKCPNGCKDGVCIKGEKQREEVKCIFKNTQTEQKCYRAEYNWMYCSSYQGSCIVTNLEGYDGEKITWKSTCGGYAYTTLDGNNEYAEFDCSGVNGSFCQSSQCDDGSWSKCYVDGSGYCVCTPCSKIIAKPVCGNGVCEAGEGEICMVSVSPCEVGKECKASSTQCKTVCPEDCKGIEGIYTKLNEKFKLQVNQPVKITDYKNIKIIFRDLLTPKCEAAVTNVQEVKTKLTAYAVAETPVESVEIIKCPEVGPMAQLEVINPEEQEEKILTLKLNEAKNVYDVSISFLGYDYASRTGVFAVNSKVSTCPLNCRCDSESYILECKQKEKCEEGKNLCPDGTCKEKCEEVAIENCDYGCLYNNKCLPIGIRVKGLYCSIDNELTNQLQSDEVCENNFECKSNVCVSGKCISESLIKKILNFFKRLFGRE